MDKPDHLEYKQVPLEIKQFGDDTEDNSFHFFEGLASTFGNKDFGDDVIEKGAFKESLKKITPTILWQHNSHEPIGMPIELKENNEGLFVKARMPKEDSLVKGRVAPQMRVKSITSMSIGFNVDEFEIKDGIRFIQKLTLWEISLVTLPMNDKAKITNFKAATPFKNLPLADRDRPFNEKEALERIKSFTDSEKAPSSTYKDAFIYYDKPNKDDFDSYKLLIADVVNGKITAVPRAIFKASKGDSAIPEKDRGGIESHITRYYNKLDLESPFEKCGLGIIEIEAMSKKDMEVLLRETSKFSRKACKLLASQFISQCEADNNQCDAGSEEELNEALVRLTKTINKE